MSKRGTNDDDDDNTPDPKVQKQSVYFLKPPLTEKLNGHRLGKVVNVFAKAVSLLEVTKKIVALLVASGYVLDYCSSQSVYRSISNDMGKFHGSFAEWRNLLNKAGKNGKAKERQYVVYVKGVRGTARLLTTKIYDEIGKAPGIWEKAFKEAKAVARERDVWNAMIKDAALNDGDTNMNPMTFATRGSYAYGPDNPRTWKYLNPIQKFNGLETLLNEKRDMIIRGNNLEDPKVVAYLEELVRHHQARARRNKDGELKNDNGYKDLKDATAHHRATASLAQGLLNSIVRETCPELGQCLRKLSWLGYAYTTLSDAERNAMEGKLQESISLLQSGKINFDDWKANAHLSGEAKDSNGKVISDTEILNALVNKVHDSKAIARGVCIGHMAKLPNWKEYFFALKAAIGPDCDYLTGYDMPYYVLQMVAGQEKGGVYTGADLNIAWRDFISHIDPTESPYKTAGAIAYYTRSVFNDIHEFLHTVFPNLITNEINDSQQNKVDFHEGLRRPDDAIAAVWSSTRLWDPDEAVVVPSKVTGHKETSREDTIQEDLPVCAYKSTTLTNSTRGREVAKKIINPGALSSTFTRSDYTKKPVEDLIQQVALKRETAVVFHVPGSGMALMDDHFYPYSGKTHRDWIEKSLDYRWGFVDPRLAQLDRITETAAAIEKGKPGMIQNVCWNHQTDSRTEVRSNEIFIPGIIILYADQTNNTNMDTDDDTGGNAPDTTEYMNTDASELIHPTVPAQTGWQKLLVNAEKDIVDEERADILWAALSESNVNPDATGLNFYRASGKNTPADILFKDIPADFPTENFIHYGIIPANNICEKVIPDPKEPDKFEIKMMLIYDVKELNSSAFFLTGPGSIRLDTAPQLKQYPLEIGYSLDGKKTVIQVKAQSSFSRYATSGAAAVYFNYFTGCFCFMPRSEEYPGFYFFCSYKAIRKAWRFLDAGSWEPMIHSLCGTNQDFGNVLPKGRLYRLLDAESEKTGVPPLPAFPQCMGIIDITDANDPQFLAIAGAKVGDMAITNNQSPEQAAKIPKNLSSNALEALPKRMRGKGKGKRMTPSRK